MGFETIDIANVLIFQLTLTESMDNGISLQSLLSKLVYGLAAEISGSGNHCCGDQQSSGLSHLSFKDATLGCWTGCAIVIRKLEGC